MVDEISTTKSELVYTQKSPDFSTDSYMYIIMCAMSSFLLYVCTWRSCRVLEPEVEKNPPSMMSEGEDAGDDTFQIHSQ